MTRFNRVIAWVVLLAVAAFLSGCAPQPQPAPDTRAADEAAIRNADAAFLKAVAARDLDGCMSQAADDAVEMNPDKPMLAGKEAIRKDWQEMFALPDVKLAWQTTKLEAAKAGDLAYQYGTYEFSMKDPKGKPVEEKGKFATVWRKQADGAWKWILDTHNSDGPPPKSEKK